MENSWKYNIQLASDFISRKNPGKHNIQLALDLISLKNWMNECLFAKLDNVNIHVSQQIRIVVALREFKLYDLLISRKNSWK